MQITEQHFIQNSVSNMWDILFKTADGKYYISTSDVSGTLSIMAIGLVRIKEITEAEALEKIS